MTARLTFDGNDQLRDDWQDLLAASSGQQVINALQRNTGGQRRVQLSSVRRFTWTAKKTYGC